eukprot:TRINITY_DN96159_c0_g1_i1.p1 TRINITY_DN96159_c0_g1~~TRINITY_DN96159_c0_g1_i1.p1  ORF type:complete len:323 (+),score=41.30 TRINITY_DN96159_c0_g1_i1:40-969(+)
MDRIFSRWQSIFGNGQVLSVNDIPCPEGSAYRIQLIPALGDNYMYLIISRREPKAVAVDPVEGDKILEACKREGVTLAAVLTTHYHSDHSGGNEYLAQQIDDLAVVAGERDAKRTPAVNTTVSAGETCCLAGLNFQCIATPCHTRGHMSFFLDENDGQAPALFCGDTLFVAGCGRFMEGTAADMLASLTKLTQLPLTTRVFCGHEYTVGNLKYALSLEPGNLLLNSRLEEAERRRAEGLPTVPSTLAQELEHNPFLRTLDPVIADAVCCPECADPSEIMSRLRRGKDTFTFVGRGITLALDMQSLFRCH